jgi:hypothetical protein
MELAVIQDVFVSNLLPILLATGTGFALGRTLHPDVKTASRLTFYIFSPCLVFVSLAHVQITGGEFGRLAFFTLAVSAIMGVLSFLCGRLLHVGRQLLVSLVVASVFVNSGNYGLAANKFAFGEAGLARQAAVLQSAMPAAVVATILAVEYDLDVPLVTGTVVLTTLASPLTLTPLIAYLLSSS